MSDRTTGKFTPDAFAASVADLWRSTASNFTRDHQIHSHLVALDSSGHGLYFLNVPTASDAQDLADRGIIAVPGPWTDHLDLLAREFRAHRAVAAVLIAEAWIRPGMVLHTSPQAAEETTPEAEDAADTELVFVLGAWPQEEVICGRYAEINRQTDPATLGTAVGLDRATLFAAWLTDLLPARA